MAKKEKQDKDIIVDSASCLENLMNELKSEANLGLESVADSKMMHQQDKVRVPSYILNPILGGGIPFGNVVELWGEPKAGKSSFAYETMGNFQADYPIGITILVESESSIDADRMIALGADPNKIIRYPAKTLEAGFEYINRTLAKLERPEYKEVPVFIMWDTIAANVTKNQMAESKVNCFTEDAKVKCLDGKTRTMRQMLEDFQKGVELWVYSYDIENQRLVPGRVIDALKTGHTKKMLKLTFDNGESVICTPDHLFLHREGVYIEAKDSLGESIMPLYYEKRGLEFHKDREDYEYITSPESIFTHRMVSRDIPKGLSRHHEDLDKLNNNPTNIVAMDHKDHYILHGLEFAKSERCKEILRERNSDPDFIAKLDATWTAERKRMHGEMHSRRLRENPQDGLLAYDTKMKIAKKKILKRLRKAYLEKGIVDEESFLSTYKDQDHSPAKRAVRIGRFQKHFQSWDDAQLAAQTYNHQVVRIEELNYPEKIELYDITVLGHHNFALEIGESCVFAHQSGGLNERSRLIKFYLNMTLALMEGKRALFFILNQVFTQFHQWGTSLGSGGGFGLKHNIHVSLKFNLGNKAFLPLKDKKHGKDKMLPIARNSSITLEKSKISPEIANMNNTIDITKGGIVNKRVSLFDFLEKLEIIIISGGWYKLNEEYVLRYEEELRAIGYQHKAHRSGYFTSLMEEEEAFLKLMQIFLIEYIGNIYVLQAKNMQGYKYKLLEEVHDLISNRSEEDKAKDLEHLEVEDKLSIHNLVFDDEGEAEEEGALEVNEETGEILEN